MNPNASAPALYSPIHHPSNIRLLDHLPGPVEVVQHSNRDPSSTADNRTIHASSSSKVELAEHKRDVEGADEAPDLAEAVDEEADLGRALGAVVDGEGDQRRRDDLDAEGRHRRTDHRRHVPVARCGVLQLHAPHHQADDHGDEAGVGEPEALGGGAGAGARGVRGQEPVGHGAGELLADDGADDDGEVLEAEGLGVEVEFLADGLGHHDDDGDVGVAEDEGVCNCWDENGGDGREVEEGDEGHEGEWRGVDAADLEVVEE